jgi:CAAX prenyl protease-like protein
MSSPAGSGVQERRLTSALLERYPSLAYIAPFAAFMLLLVTQKYLEPLGRWEFPLRVVLLVAVLWVFSRHVITFRTVAPLSSILMGISVFVLWIGPDLLFPGYRHHWLFENSITGKISSSIPAGLQFDPMVLVFRTFRAVVLVAIIEELFWRGFLMRWLINSDDFRKVPLGAYAPVAMWVTAVLFASEHGPYWDVGLLTGVIYNWWMVRTKSLGDLILTHAVTNGCLSAYVMVAGKWEYWM